MCRGLAPDILANGVLHGLVPRQPAIARVIVGMDGGVWHGVVLDKAVQRLAVRPLDWLGHHAVGGTVLGANHNRLASGRAGTNETSIGDGESEGNVQLIENDYWWKTLILDCPAEATDLTARVQVRQPQGYVQELTVEDVELHDGKAHVPILYPLVDEGRYDAKPGLWEGAWLMGEYGFDVQLTAEGMVVAAESLTLDPHSFFPSDRMVISVDARPQIIECAPRQALYQDEDTVSFVFRIRRRRVTKCHVEVDVTHRGGTAPLAGPWRYTLTHDFQDQSFSIAGWEPGEYWIRIRPLVDGQPAGPYCVRKFWKQASAALEPPAALELGGYPEVLVDDYCFEAVNDIQFVPDALDKHPDRPLVSPTQSHEGGDALHRLPGLERQRRPI